MLILNVYNIFYLKKKYSSPDFFPVDNLNNKEDSIFKTGKYAYFYRLYQERKYSALLSPEDMYKFKYELIYGTKASKKKYKMSCSTKQILPISWEKERNETTIISNNRQVTSLKNLPSKRFHYFEFEKNSNIKISSSVDFIVGKPFAVKQKKRHKKKLVLCLFIDALADNFLKKGFKIEELMPYTFQYFGNGVRFHNHFSNAEWTLPSVPTFFSGHYQQGHGFFHPSKRHRIGEGYKTLSEIFQANDYFSLKVSGNWRTSPSYGYVKGFDRTIYKREMDAHEVIAAFLEHERAFPHRDKFIWLTFMDVHHLLKMIPDVSNQLSNSISAHCVTPWYDPENNTKSVNNRENKDLIEIYKNEIRRLDNSLKIIYQYLAENYSEDDILVNLVSDHGQSFLSEDNHPLSLARTKVPWLIKGANTAGIGSYEITENVDVYPTLIKLCNLDYSDYSGPGNFPTILGGKEEKKFTLSQSIYPGQTYKAIIRDKKFEHHFTSKENVLPNGKIQGDIQKIVFPNISDSRSIGTKHCSNFYSNFIDQNIEIWNKRIEKFSLVEKGTKTDV